MSNEEERTQLMMMSTAMVNLGYLRPIADELGVAESTIRRWAKGTANPAPAFRKKAIEAMLQYLAERAEALLQEAEKLVEDHE